MPSQTRPQAKFVPISPNFDLNALVESTDNLKFVTRLSIEKLRQHPIENFEALVLAVVVQSGKPLVIEDWQSSLAPSLFSRQWLEDNLGTKQGVWDISNEVSIPMTVGHYLRSMDQLSKQITDSTYRDPRRQRLYLKDIDCPDAWAKYLQETVPECVFYFNECIESKVDWNSSLQCNEYEQTCALKDVAPAGDLMSSLPPEMRALNLMCYIGHEGTYTAAHREMCATLGQNIMVEASKDEGDEKEGSSIWFMTETNEREIVSEYFLSILGHDIEIEKHFAQVNAWKKAPFKVWVVEQKVGDLILIPPLAPHQVWNRGTRTIKAAWNRTTVDTLELALHEALPRCRMVCRDEQYKCRAVIYYTLLKYYDLLQRDTIEEKMWKYGRFRQLFEDFRRLFHLYQEIIISEIFSPHFPEERDVEMLPFGSHVTCSYCRCDIFNRFLTCKACILYGIGDIEDTYDICMDCYAMGRSCSCLSKLAWVEQWDWNILEKNYELWRCIVIRFDKYLDIPSNSFLPLKFARRNYGKKPIAEVCQEQLKIRSREAVSESKDSIQDLFETKTDSKDQSWPKVCKAKKISKPIKTAKGKQMLTKGTTHCCHICLHHDSDWKLAFCTTCSLAYCYGVLWRAFDLMPQTIMQNRKWKCPKCLNICSCGKCRKSTTQIPYQPKGTLLGHNTKNIADFRSVERLVDFSKPNLTWLHDSTPNIQDSARMKRLREKVEAEKVQRDTIEEIYLNGGKEIGPLIKFGVVNYIPSSINDIDPSLRDLTASKSKSSANGNHSSNVDCHNLSNEDIPFGPGGSARIAPITCTEGIITHAHPEDYAQHLSCYPPRAPGIVGSMMAPEQTYPDPSHHGQSRRLDTKFDQEGNMADGIIYELPTPDSRSDAQLSAPAKRPIVAASDRIDDKRMKITAKRQRISSKAQCSHKSEDLSHDTQGRIGPKANPWDTHLDIAGDTVKPER